MPREQKNTMTSWIDGSFVYSTKESWVNAMRSFENGTLKMIGDQVIDPAFCRNAKKCSDSPAGSFWLAIYQINK